MISSCCSGGTRGNILDCGVVHWFNPFVGGVNYCVFYRVGKGLTHMTTGRDPMTPMGLYVSKTLLSEVETRWRQEGLSW